tara:strand:+ start:1101 stop:1469 length:369 start_codon:yes stop_codon:yes gene_type:complete
MAPALWTQRVGYPRANGAANATTVMTAMEYAVMILTNVIKAYLHAPQTQHVRTRSVVLNASVGRASASMTVAAKISTNVQRIMACVDRPNIFDASINSQLCLNAKISMNAANRTVDAGTLNS